MARSLPSRCVISSVPSGRNVSVNGNDSAFVSTVTWMF